MELEQLDVVSRCIGQTLTPQERSNMEIGLIKRQAAENMHNIRFWGRIHGEQQDYLIAVALMPSKGYPKKKFYFCTNTSPELQQFPELPKTKAETVAKLTSRLKGDPALQLNNPAGDEPQNTEENGDASTITELDRLTWLVEEIDRSISVVPVEAYVVSSMRQVIANPAFAGLKWDQAMSLHNYFHFREPELPERAKVVQHADGIVRPGDFFDPLTQDLEGSWLVRKDNTGRLVTLRNYVYRGAFAFHQPETNNYGTVYFGDGRRNPDLAFMV